MPGRDARGRFLRGCAAGPGRPKGTARHILGERFAAALAADFVRHGAGVIEALRADKPADYLKLVLALQPKEARADGTAEDISDDELDRRIETLATALGLELKGRARDASDGEEA
jgi:predicted O-linked N-acetylglucosamine transferase (SPINDLY family)